MDRSVVGEMGAEPLRRSLRAAEAAGVPVMVHIGAEPPNVDEVLDLLRPGDIVTHCMTSQSMSLLSARGGVRRSALAARERGVLFDVGHGSGSFSFSTAEALLAAGFAPNVISSDAHQRSILGPCFDLPTCMSKFLALGMGLEEVVRAATSVPAQAFGHAQAGSLGVGRRADLAVFQVEEGDFNFFDSELEARRAGSVLVNRATFAAGCLLEPVRPSWPAPWVRLTDAQKELLQRDPEALRRPWAGILRSRDCYVSYMRSVSNPSARA
jgi:dihydroorotase